MPCPWWRWLGDAVQRSDWSVCVTSLASLLFRPRRTGRLFVTLTQTTARTSARCLFDQIRAVVGVVYTRQGCLSFLSFFSLPNGAARCTLGHDLSSSWISPLREVPWRGLGAAPLSAIVPGWPWAVRSEVEARRTLDGEAGEAVARQGCRGRSVRWGGPRVRLKVRRSWCCCRHALD